MAAKAVYIHSPDAERYKFNQEHPFNPIRLALARHLLEAAGALEPDQIVQAGFAGDDMLQLVHRADYVEAVRSLSVSSPAPAVAAKADSYGLGTEDTPYFPGMHEAAAAIVGGSVLAADIVMSGQAEHAYHMAGGLHHAFPDRGSGFCVYNDAAIAIAHIRKQYGARVLYIDTDVHHGDGVQWTFYADPDVCTYSIHETGKYLFPGTGFVSERGMDAGFGMAINLPLEPYTEDDSWLESFRLTIERAADVFKPDVIISQHGCDAHAFDPLSHIHCSMRIYQTMPLIIRELARTHTNGRWIALGGGGYDIWQVVPRAWALVWLAMTEHPLAERLSDSAANEPLPLSWQHYWLPIAERALPTDWLDDLSGWQPMPRREEIEARNKEITSIVLQQL
ncbi:acetoin utilization protein AcuC [Paenibacillus sacheonensis]|uniref:Acetoin utilization protein AcuC n=1 Tax=Paenibacillus sacheonensis TaxID=742054 RepID=A0A7X4YRD8_9BACL|nr:acetoin utilization protein AcuC [Paenibacillus sacheonensis]MBM7563551.1 acetoin utilization protein AcuC [Paenibacillus sacheonensis]NBC71150.1 acetoin utilization protein AcuC [Paenibacillus sacheonensis]